MTKYFQATIICLFLVFGYSASAQAQKLTPEERAAAAYKDNPIQATKVSPGIEKVLSPQEQQLKKEAATQAAANENVAKEQSGGDGRVSKTEATILNRYSRFREKIEK